MADLKLIALDADDLAVVAVHLQDAVLRIGDMAYQPAEKRFALVANRFDWDEAAKAADTHAQRSTQARRNGAFTRRRTGVRFERVLSAKISGLDLAAKDAVLSLLTTSFEVGDDPSGHITLRFAGGGAVRLSVECIEVALDDLGAAWATRNRPRHPEDHRPAGEPAEG
ncbi:MAG: DUF2948 family protein [Hyphomicrobium sp.]|jgi:hypothetical protein